MERRAFAFEPVGLRGLAGGGNGVGDVEHDHEIGYETRGRDRAELLDPLDRPSPHHPLVHER